MSIKDHIRRAFAPTAVNLLILLNLAITVPLAKILSLGLDETFTLDTTAHGVRYALRQSIYFELQAPLYFLIMSVVRMVSDSVFWGRLLSVVSIAITLKVVAALSERLFPRIHPAWFVAVLAVHPYLIWAATEMRLYAFSILFSSLLLLLFFDAFLAENPRRRTQIIYALVAVAAIYTHYYLGFLLVANAFALLTMRRWRLLLTYLLYMAAVGICFIPMLSLIPLQITDHTQTLRSVVSFPRGAEVVTWSAKGFILPADATPYEIVRRWLVRICYLVVAFILVKNWRRLITRENLFVGSAFLITATFYVGVVRVTGESMSQTRHFFALFLPLLLLVFALLATVGNKVRTAWLALTLAFCLVSLYYIYRPMAKYGNWAQVTAYVIEHEQPGQPIVIFHAGNAQTFGHYYRGPNVVIPLPRDNRFDTFDIRDYILKDEAQIREVIQRKAGGDPERLWLITDGVCGFMDVDYHCNILSEFVSKHYSVEGTVKFSTTTVMLLHRR